MALKRTPYEALESLGLISTQLDDDPFDVAEFNLACAGGLPGSDDCNPSKILIQLDDMAHYVEREITRNYHRFLRDPAKFNGSQARFCSLMMITVLQQDFGIRYNPDRIRDPDFRDSRDLFIHGLLCGRGGTCASMPVLYVAVGRRLGWPIRLANARAHVFCRWDDERGLHSFGSERFNIEGTSIGGHIFSDEYYRTWPEPISDDEINSGVYLKSLLPEEELASFLASRGHCLFDNRRVGDARDAYAVARHLSPQDPHYAAFHEHCEQVRDRILEERTLRDYYGPDAPLPFGVFPRQVLRKMAADMAIAIVEYQSDLNRTEEQRRRPPSEFHSAMNAERSSGIGTAIQSAMRRSVSGFPEQIEANRENPLLTVGTNTGHPSGNLLPGCDEFVTSGFVFNSGLPKNFERREPLGRLPAYYLQGRFPELISQRRQEATELLKLIPPGSVIKQPARISLRLPPLPARGIRTGEDI